MIKIQFIGNLGKDAEIKAMDGGGFVINFTVGINQSYTKVDQTKVEKTTWLDCALWKTAAQSTKVAEYLKKGTKVYIEGDPSARAYVNKENASIGVLNCRVNMLELLGSKGDGQASSPNIGSAPPANTAVDDDDLPF